MGFSFQKRKLGCMMPVESGSFRAGRWVIERRNVPEDYRRYFRQDPQPFGAIAIMTDTGNTGKEAVAYYGQIRLLSDADR